MSHFGSLDVWLKMLGELPLSLVIPGREAPVRAPCHVLYYRVTPHTDAVTLLRVLHDSWEPDPNDFRGDP